MASDSQDSSPSISFEEALERLEQIVRQLEDGQLGLSDSLACYEEGVRCLKLCHQALQQAENKIAILTAVDAEGSAQCQPFDEEAMTLEEKKAARSRRRSHGTREGQGHPKNEDDVDIQKGLF